MLHWLCSWSHLISRSRGTLRTLRSLRCLHNAQRYNILSIFIYQPCVFSACQYVISVLFQRVYRDEMYGVSNLLDNNVGRCRSALEPPCV